MKYPIRKELKKYSILKLPVNKGVLRIANALMPIVQKGKRLRKSLIKIRVRLANCSAHLLLPKDVKNPPLLIYYHGGAFLMKAAAYHKNLAQIYAEKTGCAVLFVDYRLAPKFAFPLPVYDCFDAYKWAIEQNYSKIMVGGDSAGANLALAVIQLAHQNNLSLPIAQMLVYPVTDTRMNYPSMQRFTDTPLWNSKLNPKALKLYAKKTEWHNPLISTMEAPNLSFMPPTYIETCEFDCLHDEGVALAEKLKEQAVRVVLNQTTATIHGYDIAQKSEYVKTQVLGRVDFIKTFLS